VLQTAGFAEQNSPGLIPAKTNGKHLKILPHRPPGPAIGRPEDRLWPVPVVELGPGFRREDEEGAPRTESSECI